MGFRIIFKIVVVLGVVLVIVVLLEFVLLNLYVKEIDVNFFKVEYFEKSINGVVNFVMKDFWNINVVLLWKEIGIEREKVKMDELKM